MVEQGIVLRHGVSSRGLEVDKFKIYGYFFIVLPLIHEGSSLFYYQCRFLSMFYQNLSKITVPLCKLLPKEMGFVFDQAYKDVYDELKRHVTSPSIIQPPN